MKEGFNKTKKSICFIATTPMSINAFLQELVSKVSSQYQVFIISNFSDKTSQTNNNNIIHIHISIKRRISILSDLLVLFKLIHIFNKYKFNIVHSITPKAGLLGMLAARVSFISVRIHHFTGQVWATKSGVNRFILSRIDRIIYFCASDTLADSPSQKAFLIENGIGNFDSINVLLNGSISGVDENRFKPDIISRNVLRGKYGISENSIVILFLGRMNKDKGFTEIINVMGKILPKFDNVIWFFVGLDEEGIVKTIQNYFYKFKKQIFYEKFTSEPESFLNLCDILILPSYREGFGNVLIEAAACEVPSVATRIYGIVDAVEDGKTGILFPVKDERDFEIALLRLIENPELRLSMGKYARERVVEKFSKKLLLNALLEYYDKKIEETKSIL